MPARVARRRHQRAARAQWQPEQRPAAREVTMAHPVVHFEVSGPDIRRLADFYASLFGWRLQPVPGIDYTLIDTGGIGITGGPEKVTDARPATTVYTDTDDLQSALDKINRVGGRTITPITERPGMATDAVF